MRLRRLLRSSIFLEGGYREYCVLVFRLFGFGVGLLVTGLFTRSFGGTIYYLLRFFLLVFYGFVLREVVCVYVGSRRLGFLVFLLGMYSGYEVGIVYRGSHVLSLNLRRISMLTLLCFVYCVRSSYLLFFLHVYILELFYIYFYFFYLDFLYLNYVDFFTFNFFSSVFRDRMFVVGVLMGREVLRLLARFLVLRTTRLSR